MSSVFEKVNDAAMRGFGRAPGVQRLHLAYLLRPPLRGVNPQAGAGLDPGVVSVNLVLCPRLLGPGTLSAVVDLRPPTTAPPVGDVRNGPLRPFDIATTYTISLESDATGYAGIGNPPDDFATSAIPVAPTSVTEAAQGLAALINAFSNDPEAPRAVALDYFGRGVVDCVLVTAYGDPDDPSPVDPEFVISVAAASGAGAIAASMDCDELDVEVHLRLRDVTNATPFARAFTINPNLVLEQIDESGYTERVDLAGYDAVYPRVTSVTPNSGAGSGVESHALILVADGRRETS